MQLAGCWAHAVWHRRISPSPGPFPPTHSASASFKQLSHSAQKNTAGWQKQITDRHIEKHIFLPWKCFPFPRCSQICNLKPPASITPCVSSDSGKLKLSQSFFPWTPATNNIYLAFGGSSAAFLKSKLTFSHYLLLSRSLKKRMSLKSVQVDKKPVKQGISMSQWHIFFKR